MRIKDRRERFASNSPELEKLRRVFANAHLPAPGYLPGKKIDYVSTFPPMNDALHIIRGPIIFDGFSSQTERRAFLDWLQEQDPQLRMWYDWNQLRYNSLLALASALRDLLKVHVSARLDQRISTLLMFFPDDPVEYAGMSKRQKGDLIDVLDEGVAGLVSLLK